MNITRNELHIIHDGGGYLPKVDTCPMCGKRFSRTRVHAWKLSGAKHGIYFCSYTCMRKAEKEREKKQTRRGKKKGRKTNAEMAASPAQEGIVEK